MVQTALVLFALTFAGGLLPLLRTWSERGLHAFAALSAGVFLGLVFLHLLPEMAAHAAPGASELEQLFPWICTLAGFLLLFFLERIWLEGRARRDQHRAVWYASFVGLVIHTAFTGLGLAAVFPDTRLRWVWLAVTVVHKGSEAFSLATVMRLAGLSWGASIVYLAVYSAVAPGALVGGSLLGIAQSGASPAWTGLACGTFLYVAVCDLLPEVFHGEDARWPKALLVVAGTALAGLVQTLHAH